MLQTIITVTVTAIVMLALGLGVTLYRRRRALVKHEEYREKFLADYHEASACFDRPRRIRKTKKAE